MREYKFYLIRPDGHVKGPGVDYVLQDDHAAIKQANKIAITEDIEIWEGARMVAYVVADETRQTPPPQKPDADQHK